MGRAHLILFFACDHGPKAVLKPMARHYGEQVSASILSRREWRDLLIAEGIRLLVCGTSGSEAGSMAERDARLAAKDAGIALACIEDFPGNYIHWDGAAADWLIVESEFSIRVYRSRGGHLPRMVVIPPGRYDHLRGGARETIRPRGAATILWAGQPETNDSIATLGWLLEALQGQQYRLLFRAHPRDPGWKAGQYSSLLRGRGVAWEDVTNEPLSETFHRHIDLTVSQFSSVAIEGGFHGVPALFVLLPEAGAGTLKKLKGYSVPSVCEDGAGFLVTERSQSAVLKGALYDQAEREQVMTRFREVLSTDQPSLPLATALLDSIITDSPSNRV